VKRGHREPREVTRKKAEPGAEPAKGLGYRGEAKGRGGGLEEVIAGERR